jgi:heme A synthase
MPSRLPDSPEDRGRRDEALRRILVRVAIAAVPVILIGALAVALGVPVVIVVVVCLVFAAVIIFEA